MTVVIGLGAIDLESTEAALAEVERLRRLADGGHAVVVRDCPRVLAHALYKAGLLLDGRIRVETTREG